MEKVNLANEGFPNYNLYRNGSVENIKTHQVRPFSRFIYLTWNGTSKNFSTPLLQRRYFGSELLSLPKEERKSLAFLGYPDYEVTFDGRLWSHKTEAWIDRKIVNSGGYIVVLLSNKDGQKTFKLHRLVALAFVPNPYGYDQVDHRDGCKLHNYANNLEWVTGVENARRARLKGLKKMVLTDNEIHLACRMIQMGKSDKEIAKVCRTTPTNIWHIRKGHTHCDIAQEYDIEPHRIVGRDIDYSLYKKNHRNFKQYTPKEDPSNMQALLEQYI